MRTKAQKIQWNDTTEASGSPRDAVTKEVVSTTPGGKDVQIKRDNTGLWFAEFSSGGELPVKLQQKWVRRIDAAEAVLAYTGND